MTIAPEKRQQAIQEIAERDAERLKEALLGALDEGWFLFAPGTRSDRLRAYVANTLTSDVPLVRDPDYLEKLSKGEAPLLLAVQLMNSPAVQEGRLPPPPALWPMVIGQLPGYVFQKLSRDFRDLAREEERRAARS